MRSGSMFIFVSALSLILLLLMPAASAGTIVVNASYDGSVGTGIDDAWPAMRNAPGDAVRDLDDKTWAGMTESDNNLTGTYVEHWRGLVTWDTGAANIPADATITSAIVSVHGAPHKMNELGTVDFSIIDADPTNPLAYTGGDYSETTFTRMANDISFIAYNYEAWNNLTLNAQGRAHIAKTGVTTFMLTHSADVDNSSLTWVQGPDNDGEQPASGFNIKGLINASGAYTPFITINYDLPPVASFTSNVTSGTSPLTVKFTDTSTNSPTSWNWSFGNSSWFNTTVPSERNATHMYITPSTYTVRLTVANAGGSSTTSPGTIITVNAIPTLKADKIGIYQNGAWYRDRDGSGTWNAGDTANVFGAPGWTSVLGDWNGDSMTEEGIYKDGTWYLDYNGNGIWDAGIDKVDYFGTLGWTPVVGNWNGAATGDKIGVYMDGAWYLDNDGSGTWNAGDRANVFGAPGWTPVVGNWNGDTTGTKIGIYKDGAWYLDFNGNGVWDTGIDKADIFGTVGYTPVVGNWNGAATGDKIGIYKDGAWYLDNDGSGTWNAGDRANMFGTLGWTPIIGNWNGDATGTKIGVYMDGTWYLDYNGNGAWDAGIDKVDIFGVAGWNAVVGKWH